MKGFCLLVLVALAFFGNLYLAGVNRQVYKIRIDDGSADPCTS